jgi:hypothetical protein
MTSEGTEACVEVPRAVTNSLVVDLSAEVAIVLVMLIEVKGCVEVCVVVAVSYA